MNDKQRYIFIDTETTGLDPIDNDVIEVAALVYDDETEVCRYNCRLSKDALTMVDPEALQVNHRDMLGDVGDFDGEARKSIVYGLADFFIEFATRDAVIVGHNVQFDLDFLYWMFQRYNINVKRLLMQKKKIDTRQIALFLTETGHIKPKSNRMVDVFNHLYEATGSDENDHTAMADAIMCKNIFYKMTDMV